MSLILFLRWVENEQCQRKKYRKCSKVNRTFFEMTLSSLFSRVAARTNYDNEMGEEN